jgi:hypothetical protein
VALLPYQAPSIFVNASNNEPPVFQAPVVASNIIFANDIAFFIPGSSGLTAGATRGAAGGGGTYQYTNAAGSTGGVTTLSAALLLAGIAIHSSYSTFGGPALTTALTQNGEQQYPLFPTQVSTAANVNLLSSEPGNMHVNTLSGNLLEVSLSSATTWATSMLGTGVTIGLDYTGGQFFICGGQGTSLTTAPFIIAAKPEGPGKGGIGDTGVRVLVVPNTGVYSQYILQGQ